VSREQDFCGSRHSKAAFSHLEIERVSLPTLSNLQSPGYTLLVFCLFIFYNPSKIAQVGAGSGYSLLVAGTDRINVSRFVGDYSQLE
jgi:hypothetical protein